MPVGGPRIIPIFNGLLDRRHVKALGPAIYEFLLLVDWQTSDDGLVRGGQPIQIQSIAELLGRSFDTASRNLARLARKGYITRTRVPYGWIFRITKPKKRFGKSTNSAESRLRKNAESLLTETPQKCGTESADMPSLIKNHKKNTQSPSPSDFDQWWDFYPRKVAKRDARRAFDEQIHDRAHFESLIDNTLRWAGSSGWSDPQYIPYPATFLRRGDWEAPPPTNQQGPKMSWE